MLVVLLFVSCSDKDDKTSPSLTSEEIAASLVGSYDGRYMFSTEVTNIPVIKSTSIASQAEEISTEATLTTSGTDTLLLKISLSNVAVKFSDIISHTLDTLAHEIKLFRFKKDDDTVTSYQVTSSTLFIGGNKKLPLPTLKATNISNLNATLTTDKISITIGEAKEIFPPDLTSALSGTNNHKLNITISATLSELTKK